MVKAEQLDMIQKVSWHKGETRTNLPNALAPEEEYPPVFLREAYNGSVRLYRDFLLPVLKEAGISLVGQKVRIVGGGVGSALDAAALMHVTGASAVEVVEVDKDDVKLAQDWQRELSRLTEFHDAVGRVTIIPADAATLPKVENKIDGQAYDLGFVPVSIVRSIPYSNARKIVQGMINSTQQGGLIVATIANLGRETDSQKELDQLTTILGEQGSQVTIIGQPKMLEPQNWINGGRIFTGDRAIVVAQINIQQKI